MSNKYKIVLFIFAYMYFPIFASEESKSFQNISIHSDQVTFNQDLRQLVFKNNIEIKIDSYTLRGSNAILNSKDKKLEIFGSPASIKSETIDGEAEALVIYPNKSMNLVGNARLLKEGNSITSDFITYQISSNE
ncbi:LptA/OstA family protein [Gammaproteobacteria bacterium]|jgi:lipopolysaccharide transport protein LptA|nr:LptA/OstA family protein [Gammaproteobacteria bacterium]